MSATEKASSQKQPSCEEPVRPKDPRIDLRDDMYDEPSAMGGHGYLASALRILETEVSCPYWGYNLNARRWQRGHQVITWLALLTATSAVALAILQLPLRQFGWEWLAKILPYLEFSAALGAAVFVILGLLVGVQKRWLVERHKAERLRFLKYSSLLKAAKVGSDNKLSEWSAEVRAAASRIDGIGPAQLKAWRAEGPRATRLSSGKASVRGEFGEIEEYYKRKRLEKQLDYFIESEDQALERDSATKYWPLACFLLSVGCAILHLLISNDFLGIQEPLSHLIAEQVLGTVLMSLAALLPLLGAAIRTYRSANEFSRNSVRFGAVRHILEGIQQSLTLEIGPEAKLEQLARCEQTLEDEHREWLRLMDEAEWYG